jgi:hypothetical protein
MYNKKNNKIRLKNMSDRSIHEIDYNRTNTVF